MATTTISITNSESFSVMHLTVLALNPKKQKKKTMNVWGGRFCHHLGEQIGKLGNMMGTPPLGTCKNAIGTPKSNKIDFSKTQIATKKKNHSFFFTIGLHKNSQVKCLLTGLLLGWVTLKEA
jgi:hypothetical protein